ncbi:MAG TPA: hypothetical protein VE153_27195 [Myxococcus sp.]|nr:hypothetical protein [Myxococcus sp.]
MGNASGRAKQKPTILAAAPGVEPGIFSATFSEEADRDVVTLKSSGTQNAYFLPWKNGTYTECEINLSMGLVDYFFTADLSGCSLWYKFDSGKMKIRHEARTDKPSQRVHTLAGFQCVVDSSLNPDDVQLVLDDKTMVRTSRFYVVYALFDYDAKVADFRVQHVGQKKNLLSKAESYELIKVESVTVDFPRD